MRVRGGTRPPQQCDSSPQQAAGYSRLNSMKSGLGAWERAGLLAGTGPFRAITQLAVYDFDEETKSLRFVSLNPFWHWGCQVKFGIPDNNTCENRTN